MKTKPLVSVLLCGLFILLASSAVTGQTSDTWLGVYTQTIDEDLMEAFSLNHNRGAIIKKVVPGSPADKAGLERGDIIIKLGNKELIDSDDLSKTVLALNAGDEVDILIIRDGKKETITAILGSGDREDFEPGQIFKWYGEPQHGKPQRGGPKCGKPSYGMPHMKSQYFNFQESGSNNTYIGISLENLTDQLGEYFGLKDGNGILVTEVVEDSPAKKAGLKAGDVIIKVDGDKVADIPTIQKAVRQKEEGEKVEITLLRNKKQKKLSIEVAEAPADLNMPSMPHPSVSDNFHSFMPKMKEMLYGDWDDKGFSVETHKNAMNKMQGEIDNLKKELKEIKKKIN